MPRLVALLRRRDDLSVAEFRSYYETHHVPLIMKHCGEFITGYSRRYVDTDNPFLRDPASGERGRVDVITELAFADHDAMRRMFDAASAPAIRDEVRADEERFLDRDSIRFLIVDKTSMSVLTTSAAVAESDVLPVADG
jgi:hypothetical protein